MKKYMFEGEEVSQELAGKFMRPGGESVYRPITKSQESVYFMGEWRMINDDQEGSFYIYVAGTTIYFIPIPISEEIADEVFWACQDEVVPDPASAP